MAVEDGTRIKCDGQMFVVKRTEDSYLVCYMCDIEFLEHEACKKCTEQLDSKQYLKVSL